MPQNKIISSLKKGFTLPELLIVMTVIAGLASIMLVSYPATQRRARDTRRKNDIKQYQTSMEIYYNKSNKYPTASSLSAACTALGLTTCIDDPRASAGQHYSVSSNDAAYLIYGTLEQPPSPTTYFYTCSTGKSGETTSNPSSTNPC